VSHFVDEHRLYLSDAVRVAAYESALAAIVKPDDVVVDLGSGTGILGLLACRAGAARVYAIESGGMVQPARAIVHANDLDGRVKVVNGFSGHVTLPEQADVLVTDQIGHFGFDAGIVGYVADARRRLLKPGARVVPERIDLWIAPVEAPDVNEAVNFWSQRPAGFDMSPLRDIAANSGQPRTIAARELLADPVCGGSIGLAVDARTVHVTAETSIARDGVMHGVAGWFSAELGGGVVMTNAPIATNRIARRGVVFPLERPVTVKPGDRIRVDMRILPDDQIVRWVVDVRRAEGGPPERFVHSTLHGMLIPAEQLRRTRPDSVPRLNPRGRARLSVLELCDGRRSLDEIEREIFSRHAALFADQSEAATFVAEVVTGYAE